VCRKCNTFISEVKTTTVMTQYCTPVQRRHFTVMWHQWPKTDSNGDNSWLAHTVHAEPGIRRNRQCPYFDINKELAKIYISTECTLHLELQCSSYCWLNIGMAFACKKNLIH